MFELFIEWSERLSPLSSAFGTQLAMTQCYSVLDCVAGADNFVDVLIPIPPQGSPLSFAILVCAGCTQLGRVQLELGASPLGDLLGNTGDSLSSRTCPASSLHSADLFLLLWEYAVTKFKSGDHELDLSPETRCVLISGLSVRSVLDLKIGDRSLTIKGKPYAAHTFC